MTHLSPHPKVNPMTVSPQSPAFVPASFRGAPLVDRYLAGDPAALRFFSGGHPADASAYEAKALEIDTRITRADRERLARVLVGGGADRDARLHKFVASGGYAVTTGQQPGLFGGPLFVLHKAFTAAALAARLERRLGRIVLPIFWVASEDHDWDEARRIHLLDPANEGVPLEVEAPEGFEQAPLFRVPPTAASFEQAQTQLFGALPPTDFHAGLAEAVTQAYEGGATLPGGFAALLAGQLAEYGVFLLSPDHPELQAARAPLLLAEAEGARASEAALTAWGHDLEGAGFHPPQVPLLWGGVNLFLETEGRRERLYVSNAEGTSDETPRFRARQGAASEGTEVTLEELRARVEADPGVLTPNVLLRPVVESTLIPTLAYVAGPGEMAYWGQLGPLFERHGVRPPVVHPRWTGTLLETKIEKVLTKLGVPLEALRRPLHELAAERARDELPEALIDTLQALEATLEEGSEALRVAIQQVDPTLKGTVDHLRGQTRGLLADVKRKATQAVKKTQAIELEQLEKAQRHLFPLGLPQERVFPAVYYVARYGPILFDAWRAAVEDAVRLSEA